MTFTLPQEVILLKGSRPSILPIQETHRSLLSRLLEAWTTNPQDADVRLYAALLLSPFLQIQRRTKEAAPSTDQSTELIAAVNRLVLSRLQNPIDGKHIAQALHISESHLRSLFRRAAGIPLSTHVRHLRVQSACAMLLQNRAQRVGEIACACGFPSVYTFSRTFRALMGCSPRGFRDGTLDSPSRDEKNSTEI